MLRPCWGMDASLTRLLRWFHDSEVSITAYLVLYRETLPRCITDKGPNIIPPFLYSYPNTCAKDAVLAPALRCVEVFAQANGSQQAAFPTGLFHGYSKHPTHAVVVSYILTTLPLGRRLFRYEAKKLGSSLVRKTRRPVSNLVSFHPHSLAVIPHVTKGYFYSKGYLVLSAEIFSGYKFIRSSHILYSTIDFKFR